MGLDLRPPMAPFVEAFGVPITITRPVPDDAAVTTTGIWLSPIVEEQPFGRDFQRREPLKVMSIPLSSTLSSVPRGTTIVAPESLGAADRTWMVEGLARPQEVEVVQVFVRPIQDLL